MLLLFIYLGLQAALQRTFAEHRDWMLRSYALTAIAITLADASCGKPPRLRFLPTYKAIAWLSWTTNLALVEYAIPGKRGGATSYPALATA